MKYIGPVGIFLGLILVLIGALLQVNGAAAVVFCSTIGAGIVLIVAAGGYWLVSALRHRTPGPIAA
ncbi:MAG TPA: hypothetical protein VFR33_01965 [Candidatus Dormibacteraeota bacterium]|nr:hypothetical protein [Candidatus Dormibacteraeota bacterium]